MPAPDHANLNWPSLAHPLDPRLHAIIQQLVNGPNSTLEFRALVDLFIDVYRSICSPERLSYLANYGTGHKMSKLCSAIAFQLQTKLISMPLPMSGPLPFGSQTKTKVALVSYLQRAPPGLAMLKPDRRSEFQAPNSSNAATGSFNAAHGSSSAAPGSNSVETSGSSTTELAPTVPGPATASTFPAGVSSSATAITSSSDDDNSWCFDLFHYVLDFPCYEETTDVIANEIVRRLKIGHQAHVSNFVHWNPKIPPAFQFHGCSQDAAAIAELDPSTPMDDDRSTAIGLLLQRVKSVTYGPAPHHLSKDEEEVDGHLASFKERILTPRTDAELELLLAWPALTPSPELVIATGLTTGQPLSSSDPREPHLIYWKGVKAEVEKLRNVSEGTKHSEYVDKIEAVIARSIDAASKASSTSVSNAAPSATADTSSTIATTSSTSGQLASTTTASQPLVATATTTRLPNSSKAPTPHPLMITDPAIYAQPPALADGLIPTVPTTANDELWLPHVGRLSNGVVQRRHGESDSVGKGADSTWVHAVRTSGKDGGGDPANDIVYLSLANHTGRCGAEWAFLMAFDEPAFAALLMVPHHTNSALPGTGVPSPPLYPGGPVNPDGPMSNRVRQANRARHPTYVAKVRTVVDNHLRHHGINDADEVTRESLILLRYNVHMDPAEFLDVYLPDLSLNGVMLWSRSCHVVCFGLDEPLEVRFQTRDKFIKIPAGIFIVRKATASDPLVIRPCATEDSEGMPRPTEMPGSIHGSRIPYSGVVGFIPAPGPFADAHARGSGTIMVKFVAHPVSGIILVSAEDNKWALSTSGSYVKFTMQEEAEALLRGQHSPLRVADLKIWAKFGTVGSKVVKGTYLPGSGRRGVLGGSDAGSSKTSLPKAATYKEASDGVQEHLRNAAGIKPGANPSLLAVSDASVRARTRLAVDNAFAAHPETQRNNVPSAQDSDAEQDEDDAGEMTMGNELDFGEGSDYNDEGNDYLDE